MERQQCREVSSSMENEQDVLRIGSELSLNALGPTAEPTVLKRQRGPLGGGSYRASLLLPCS